MRPLSPTCGRSAGRLFERAHPELPGLSTAVPGRGGERAPCGPGVGQMVSRLDEAEPVGVPRILAVGHHGVLPAIAPGTRYRRGFTVTANAALALLPLESLASHRTVVFPTLKRLPDFG